MNNLHKTSSHQLLQEISKGLKSAKSNSKQIIFTQSGKSSSNSTNKNI